MTSRRRRVLVAGHDALVTMGSVGEVGPEAYVSFEI
jgi:hypothetical protein